MMIKMRRKKNPVHLFYKVVPISDDGKIGDDRDIHYYCLHGVHKVCTIKKTMKSNLTGAFNTVFHLYNLSLAFTVLVNNLKSVTPIYV